MSATNEPLPLPRLLPNALPASSVSQRGTRFASVGESNAFGFSRASASSKLVPRQSEGAHIYDHDDRRVLAVTFNQLLREHLCDVDWDKIDGAWLSEAPVKLVVDASLVTAMSTNRAARAEEVLAAQGHLALTDDEAIRFLDALDRIDENSLAQPRDLHRHT